MRHAESSRQRNFLNLLEEKKLFSVLQRITRVNQNLHILYMNEKVKIVYAPVPIISVRNGQKRCPL